MSALPAARSRVAQQEPSPASSWRLRRWRRLLSTQPFEGFQQDVVDGRAASLQVEPKYSHPPFFHGPYTYLSVWRHLCGGGVYGRQNAPSPHLWPGSARPRVGGRGSCGGARGASVTFAKGEEKGTVTRTAVRPEDRPPLPVAPECNWPTARLQQERKPP